MSSIETPAFRRRPDAEHFPTDKERRALGLGFFQVLFSVRRLKRAGILKRGMSAEEVADVVVAQAMAANPAAWLPTAPVFSDPAIDWEVFMEWVVEVLIPLIMMIIGLF